MNKFKYVIFMLLCVLMLATAPDVVSATETSTATDSTSDSIETTETESITGIFEKAEAGTPTFQCEEPPSLSKNSKKTKITWSGGGYGMAKIYGYEISYEIQRSTSKKCIYQSR